MKQQYQTRYEWLHESYQKWLTGFTRHAVSWGVCHPNTARYTPRSLRTEYAGRGYLPEMACCGTCLILVTISTWRQRSLHCGRNSHGRMLWLKSPEIIVSSSDIQEQL